MILFLNLNYFKWYQSLSKTNYIIAAVVFTAVFLCYADFSTLIKDKYFLLLLGCNVVSVVGLIINKSFLLTALVIYSFSVMLYLSDKVVLSVAGRRFLEYIDNLKKLGIYDKSTIIVMADHGEFGDTDSIFFVKKPFEEHEEMEIDESIITHHDFQDIIIESLR